MFSRWVIGKKAGASATKHMRCEMLKYSVAIMVIGAWVGGTGCVDNEQSFYIDHVKSQPDAPECVISEGDNWISSTGLDLSVATGYIAPMLVTNALVSRENSANLQAETNGIFVDGAESYLESADGLQIGGTEYFDQPVWIEPESKEIAFAVMVSASQVFTLADDLDCLRATDENYPRDTLGDTDTNGQVVGRSLMSVYANVRLLGHTNGTLDVETQLFRFLINICCGCHIDWGSCADPCTAFCTPPEYDSYCDPGVFGDGVYPCGNIYFDSEATWDCEDADGLPATCGCETCQ